MNNEISFSRVNNFNLIRLFAALQVVFSHCMHHLNVETEWLVFLNNHFLKYFPGVPVFFFISGFLIYWSFERNSENLKKFFKNRFLRIYPALWACLIFTIVILLFFTKNAQELISNTDFYIWIAAQFTFFQFYTPEILRFWGCGTPNGSLWTIVVELQFYLLVPAIYFLIKKNIKFTLLILILSIGLNIFISTIDNASITKKLGAVFVFPYLYYFIFGILTYIYWNKIKNLIENKIVIWFTVYMIWNWFFNIFLEIETVSYWIESPFNLVSDIILLFFVFSTATTRINLSNKLLGSTDISYGVYIYHMLIINIFISYDLTNNPYYLLLTLIIVSLISYLSWVLVEKPLLNFKKQAILSK